MHGLGVGLVDDAAVDAQLAQVGVVAVPVEAEKVAGLAVTALPGLAGCLARSGILGGRQGSDYTAKAGSWNHGFACTSESGRDQR